MKKCTRCDEDKPEEAFSRRKKKRQPWCKDCMSELSQRRYAEDEELRIDVKRRRREVRVKNRKLVLDYLREHPCVDCGEPDPIVLEFDHKDPSQKKGNVSSMTYSHSWPTVLKEIEKCDVRCANCHRRRTIKEKQWLEK